ncbi:crosslink repair DNA glycosylase YcaQ family protein [Actinotalea sp.]|uniref:winged helix-turn-helix domain-containing protein n=1 Tax=Actinotalea sp. TaxID=1872145 RepID=UPI002D068D8D|nr:crosslink repair DNA glycosylase YcaQ family protein [Actinotalea sp.]HQY34847.1 crosslink repair DNA glycosylase YcaQ family protein [Actinotalea sp.]HRA49993.1 crosslink repair DNA glycosylase YcaQ family protein [Actinotalea sp.]
MPTRLPSRPADLSLAQARRIALRAQGLDRPRRPGGPATMRHLQGVVDRLGLLQIDSVNVLARAHLVPTFSRVGPYDVGLLDRAAGTAPRRLVETWAHEASLVPPSTYRLLGWGRHAFRERWWSASDGFVHEHAAALDEIRAMVRDEGPVTARQVHARFESRHPHAGGGWWDWSVAKEGLERLFRIGEVACAGRTTSFERRYDLVERVLPAHVLAEPEPDEADAVRALLEIGARAHGIGTAGCFADYFRLRSPHVPAALAALVEDGVLAPVTVRGWDRPTYLHRDAELPRRATGRALLSPFDPLVFERRRLEELFGTRYRIEIYVPAHRRVHGYYVLPFLLGDRIAARVDLKADRRAGVLLVQAAHREPAAPGATAGQAAGRVPDGLAASHSGLVPELRAELDLMARWLGLSAVARAPGAHGDLADALL